MSILLIGPKLFSGGQPSLSFILLPVVELWSFSWRPSFTLHETSESLPKMLRWVESKMAAGLPHSLWGPQHPSLYSCEDIQAKMTHGGVGEWVFCVTPTVKTAHLTPSNDSFFPLGDMGYSWSMRVKERNQEKLINFVLNPHTAQTKASQCLVQVLPKWPPRPAYYPWERKWVGALRARASCQEALVGSFEDEL